MHFMHNYMHFLNNAIKTLESGSSSACDLFDIMKNVKVSLENRLKDEFYGFK